MTKGNENKKLKEPLSQSAVQGIVMPDPDGVNLDKRAFVRKQTRQAMDTLRPFVRCGCLLKLNMTEAYKCLYCGEWYCATCGEIHFGKTREEHLREGQT